MNIKFLGCGAAEGVPAMFCSCKLCQQAREKKVYRSRSQLLINDDLLIDFPPDSYYRSLHLGVNLGNIENILVTHSHSDHLYSEDFFARGIWSSFCTPKEKLVIHGNASVRNLIEQSGYVKSFGQYEHKSTSTLNGYDVFDRSSEFMVHKPYDTFTLGKYTVTTLPACHIPGEECFIYLIKEGGKTLLYATDTGFLLDEVFDYFIKNNVKLDAMIVDGTYGLVRCDDKAHMDFYENATLKKKMLSLGIIGKDTKCFITHVFHGSAKDLDTLELAVPTGYILPYDGYEFKI